MFIPVLYTVIILSGIALIVAPIILMKKGVRDEGAYGKERYIAAIALGVFVLLFHRVFAAIIVGLLRGVLQLPIRESAHELASIWQWTPHLTVMSVLGTIIGIGTIAAVYFVARSKHESFTDYLKSKGAGVSTDRENESDDPQGR